MDFPLVEPSFWVMFAEENDPCLVTQTQGVRVMQIADVSRKPWLDGILLPLLFPNPRRGSSVFDRGIRSFGN